MYDLLLGVVIPLLSVYLGFAAYPWWSIVFVGSGALLTYAVYHPKAVHGAIAESGIPYLLRALLFNSVLPAALFAVGRGASYLIYGV